MKYNIILIDPPWQYKNWSQKVNGAAKAQYNCMSLDELKALPIQEIADENCAIFLWITHPKMVEGCHVELFKAWGFKPISTAFTWVKTNRDGSPYMGIGFYTRGDSELCLLGIKGKMKVVSKKVRQTVVSPRKKHSSKPNEEVRKRIIELFGSLPRVELFARNSKKLDDQGWMNLGLEVDGQDIKDALKQIIGGTYV